MKRVLEPDLNVIMEDLMRPEKMIKEDKALLKYVIKSEKYFYPPTFESLHMRFPKCNTCEHYQSKSECQQCQDLKLVIPVEDVLCIHNVKKLLCGNCNSPCPHGDISSICPSCKF